MFFIRYSAGKRLFFLTRKRKFVMLCTVRLTSYFATLRLSHPLWIILLVTELQVIRVKCSNLNVCVMHVYMFIVCVYRVIGWELTMCTCIKLKKSFVSKVNWMM